MHESQHSSHGAWAHTKRAWSDADPAPSRVSTVSTLRVKVIGGAADASAVAPKRRFDKTQSYGRVLPSYEDCIAVDSAMDEERNVYLDVTGLFDREESREYDVAFARTLPAVTPLPAFAESGIRTRPRPQLWLEPRDRAAAVSVGPRHAQPDAAPTLRISAMSRTRRTWDCQTAVAAISTAAAISLTTLLAVRLLFP